MFDLVLKGGRVFSRGKPLNSFIGVNDGKIVEVSGSLLKGSQVIDCSGCIVLPGAIDGHVHFRVPGADYKEDWETGSSAAAAGGVTTVLDMPNTNPALTTLEHLEEKREIVSGQSFVDYGFHFGATKFNRSQIENSRNIASIKIFMGSSTGSLLVDDLEAMRKICISAKRIGRPVTVHAEDEKIIQRNAARAKNEGLDTALFHSDIRPANAEIEAISYALKNQEKSGNDMHFLHVSTKKGMELVRDAKRKGKKISCEATPHHLFLTSKDAGKLGNFGKMNPPLRSKEDKLALWQGIESNIIDSVATDHAPHTVAEKNKPYWDAPAGVPGIETMMPLMLNAVNEGKLALAKMVKLCCERPAGIFGIRGKGAIAKGFDADFAIVNMNKTFKARNGNLFTKCNWSPFNGMQLQGAVVKTIVRGQLVFDSGKIVGEPKGKEVEFSGGTYIDS